MRSQSGNDNTSDENTNGSYYAEESYLIDSMDRFVLFPINHKGILTLQSMDRPRWLIVIIRSLGRIQNIGT